MNIGNSTAEISTLNRPLEDTVSSLKESEYYQEVQEKLAADRNQRGIWVKAQGKAGETEYYLDVAKLSSKSFFTTVKTHEGTMRVPLAVKMILGERIQLKDKVEALMESYMKSVLQTTSHNLIMSKLGGIKMASMAFVLSLLGVPVDELKKLKKQALEDAIAENMALLEENIYNMELLGIVGSSNKKALAEMEVLQEIQTQIMTQARKLNLEAYYTKEQLLETRIKVSKEILFKFKEEEQNIQYEIDYFVQGE